MVRRMGLLSTKGLSMRTKLKKLGTLSLALVLPACSANWVQKQYYPNRAGAVYYLNEGASTVRDYRRDDAFKKITEFCGSDGYTVMSEGFQDKPSGVLGGPLSRPIFVGTFISSDHAVINFQCGKPANAAAVSQKP